MASSVSLLQCFKIVNTFCSFLMFIRNHSFTRNWWLASAGYLDSGSKFVIEVGWFIMLLRWREFYSLLKSDSTERGRELPTVYLQAVWATCTIANPSFSTLPLLQDSVTRHCLRNICCRILISSVNAEVVNHDQIEKHFGHNVKKNFLGEHVCR